MASITYTDLDKSAPTVTVRGVEFKDGEAVESNDVELVKSLAGNPYFQISGAKEPDKSDPDKPQPDEPDRPAPPSRPGMRK